MESCPLEETLNLEVAKRHTGEGAQAEVFLFQKSISKPCAIIDDLHRILNEMVAC
jgi:hypothetical protein